MHEFRFDRFPKLGSLAKLSPRFWGEFSQRSKKKNGRQYYPEQKKMGRKNRGISRDDFCVVFLKDAGRCVSPFIDVR